jgi:hypothetical protein
MELPERLLRTDRRNLVAIGPQSSRTTLMTPVTSEAKSRARRTGSTYANVSTLSMGTWEPCHALPPESVSLRPMHDRGRSLRSSLPPGKPATWQRGAVRNSAGHRQTKPE